MSFICGMLLFVLLFWVLFVTGLVHCLRACSIRKERRYRGGYQPGRSGSPTSNSRRAFRMDVEKVEKKPARVLVTGILRGCIPVSNDVVYLETDQLRLPVYVCKVHQLDMPEETDGVRVSVRLACVPAKAAAQMTAAAPEEIHLTNLRISPSNEEVNTPDPEEEIRGPIVVTAPVKEMLSSAGISALGFFDVFICIWAAVALKELSAGVLVLLLCGLLIGGVGFASLLSLLCFRMVLTEDRAEVRRLLKKHAFHINNLRYSAVLASDKTEKWMMEITDTAGGRVASINSRYRGYAQAYELFRRAAWKRAEERQQAAAKEALRGYLTQTVFYIPAELHQGEDPSDPVAVPEIMVHKGDRTRYAFLYDEVAAAQDGAPLHPVIRTTIEDALSLLNTWQLDALLVFPSGDQFPESVLITEESWKTLQDV